jgi:hypothetical protein
MAEDETPPAAAAGGLLAGLLGGIFLILMAMGVGACLVGVVVIAALTVLGNSISDKFEDVAHDVHRNAPP